jgi:hypothetical protein
LCHDLLRDARLYDHLLRLDEDIAADARAAGCPRCRGRLDAAHYERKPRGGPELPAEHCLRFSWCCDRCRQRVTPPSVRFFGRRVYLAPALLIITAMTRRLTRAVVRKLRVMFGVDRRTVIRWRHWWRELFPVTAFWRGARGRLMPPVDEGDLPSSLLARFDQEGKDRLVLTLRFLSPLTTSSVMAG